MKIAATDLETAIFKRMLNINPGRGINRSDNPKVYEKNAYYLEYQTLNNLQSDAAFMETQGILWQLMSGFIGSDQFKQKALGTIHSKVMDAINYMQVHIGQTLTVAHLAARANQHPDYFSRLFFQYTGQRPLVYLNQKRIERAQYLIVTTDMSFSDIAEHTGYETLSYFSTIFKKISGITPASYRNRQQQLGNF